MHLTPFILLPATLFWITFEAYAIPLTREQTGLVKLPLQRTAFRRDLHPQILLQRHINRSHRRLARMTGTVDGSPSIYLGRLAAREAQITARNIHVGHAGAKDGSHLGPNGTSTEQTFEADVTGSTTDAANGNQGFSPIDVTALANATLTPANTPTTQNSIGLADEGADEGYVAIIQMGTPPRTFNLLVDSGSADLWVGSEGCVSTNGTDCGNHVFLGPQSSSSFQNTTNTFQVQYGLGAVSGNVVTDNVAIAGLQLNNHTFGVATQETENFVGPNSAFDGIMGLAKSTISEQRVPTVVESLADNGLIQNSITSYKLSRLADQKNDGEVTFGGLDTSKFDPNTVATIHNINPQGFWEAAIDKVSLNGQDLNLVGRTGILDTGTTLLIVPPGDAQIIHQAIPGTKSDGNGGFTVPCTTNASIAITFGGKEFAIDSRDLAFAPLDPNNLTGDCASGIAEGQVGGPKEWLVGDTFLKNVYFSTDVGRNTIQLAKLI